MHNGTRIAYGTYGTEDTEYVMKMIEANRGVHEPQEEKVFQQVLPLMPSGAVMLEPRCLLGLLLAVVRVGRRRGALLPRRTRVGQSQRWPAQFFAQRSRRHFHSRLGG